MMIHLQRKRYQLVFWQGPDRSGIGLKLEFDTRSEAERVFAEHRDSGKFQTGLFYEWDKQGGENALLDYYPASAA